MTIGSKGETKDMTLLNDQNYMEMVGIFKGKKGKINTLVLEALYKEGFMSAWEISKFIHKNDPERKDKNWYHQSQSVNSLLTRKNGRLEELEKKEYIQNTKHGYHITFPKGYCATLLSLEHFIVPKTDISNPDLLLRITKKHFEKLGVQVEETLEDAIRLCAEVTSKEESYYQLKQATKGVLDLGLNLDSISNKELGRLLGIHFETITQRQMENGKADDIILQNPETRKRALKILVKTRERLEEVTNEALQAMKAVEKYVEKYEQKDLSSQKKDE